MSTTPNPTEAPSAPPGPPGPQRRLVRLVDDRKWAGVASGLAWYFSVDPTIVRVLFFVLNFMTGGMAFGLYLVLWFVLPKATRAEVGPPPPRSTLWRSNGAIALTIVGGLLLISAIDLFRGDVLFAGLLIGAGILLFDDDRGRVPSAIADALQQAGQALGGKGGDQTAAPSTAAPDAATPPADGPAPGEGSGPADGAGPADGSASGRAGESAEGWQAWHSAPHGPHPWADHLSGRPTEPVEPPLSAYRSGYAGRWDPHEEAPPVRPPRPRSTLGPLTVAVWLLSLGAAIAMDRLGIVALGPASVIGLTVLVAGTGLVVGSVFGRARWLIPVGIIGSLLLVASGVLGVAAPWMQLDAGVGEATHAPTTLEELQDRYAIGLGSLQLDLSRVPLDGQTIEVDASVGLGEIRVTVPPDVDVVATGSLGLGDWMVLSEGDEGGGLTIEAAEDLPDDEGTVVLDLRGGVAEIVVERGERR